MEQHNYDNKQQIAIDAQSGYFLVLAPPGWGKTDILSQRIVQAKGKGVAFEDMLCLTFTNRASRGMKNRIMEKIGEDASNIFVGNVHRYCSNFLFANSLIPENTCIIDDEDQTDIFLSFDSSLPFPDLEDLDLSESVSLFSASLSAFFSAFSCSTAARWNLRAWAFLLTGAALAPSTIASAQRREKNFFINP